MAKKASKQRKKGSFWRSLGKWTGTFAVWSFIGGLFVIGWFYTDLPDVEESMAPTRRPTVWILDRSGDELAAVGDLYGIPVKLTDLPASLPEAVLATEDRRFYSHFGVDVIGLARAMVANVQAGRIVQGGSTITQQVAKNLFLSPARTYKRKIQEVMLALWLEHNFTKDQILELYLNRVYLGAGTYGVDAAARKYFGKSATDLTLWQSAMIAGLLKAPSRYNPHASDERAEKRTNVVLVNMVNAGYIDEDDVARAKTKKQRGVVQIGGRRAPYFVDWVLDHISDYVGVRDRDLIVQTTLDAKTQRAAEKSLRDIVRKHGKSRRVTEGAILVMSTDGAVRAMVGGARYKFSQFNRATQARRQPGSAFKPVVYLAGLKSGLSPFDIVEDKPVRVGDWQPKNFNGKYLGPVSVTDGLAKSINTVAVRVTMKAGVSRVIETARTLGLDPGDAPDASIALGTAETTLINLTAAYAPFANGGNGVIPFGIAGIRDNGGKVFYERSGAGPGPVVDAHLVGPMNDMLGKVIDGGTGKAARLDREAAGKTGTSQNYRDAWFVGYTSDYIAGVWLGNDDGTPTNGVTGGSLPARVWRSVMTVAHSGTPARALPKPEDTRGLIERLFTTIEDVKQEATKVVDKVTTGSGGTGGLFSNESDRN